jgi:glycosyltransferase involved in cell wall biosynthesis
MRICMLNDNFYRGSGIARAIERIIRTPAFQGVDVYLAGCEKLSGKKSTQENTGMVPPDRYRFFPLMESNATLIPALYRFGKWVHEMRFDLLHVHHRRLAVYSQVIGRLAKVPVLFTGHLTFPSAMWFRELSPRTVSGVSSSVVDYLRRCTKAVEVRLIHNPVDFPDAAPCLAAFGHRRVLFFGRLDPVKGLETLVEAWRHLKTKGIEAQLDIYGEGPLRSRLEKQIVELGLENNVRLCGFVADIRERLPSYSFNVLVSRVEGFPNSVVEAAALAIPTLLTLVDGSRDTLPPNLSLSNGLPYGDTGALVDALAQWLTAPQLLQADGRLFYDYLKVRCSPSVIGKQYLDLYSELLLQ